LQDWQQTNEHFIFYVSKCFLNLINFDQLNEIRCFMSYKSNLFTIEDQDIIAKKRVNNVFFFELWKHVSYNFIITFIVDNFVATFVESSVESLIESSSAVNKEILNIWHARLKHLREQNVRLSQAAVQKQDCGITWCDYSHVMWLRWLCIERNNFDSSISTYIKNRSS
jgi:hypothetical protein